MHFSLVKNKASKVKRSKHAFTLVELLVVISILALLMAILMPGLSKARSLAKRSVCSNNLRQIGIALAAYGATDSFSRLPESNGYTCKYIPMGAYETLKSVSPGDQKIFVCPEYRLFKEQIITDLSDSELNRTYRWEPFPSSYDDGEGMWIGYFYLGGRDMSNWDWKFMPPDGNKWISPLTLTASGKLPVMVDLIEQAAGRWHWTEAVHRRGGWAMLYTSGGVEPDEIGAEGGNSLHLDGSVVWSGMSKLTKYPRSQPGAYRPFGYWYGGQ